MNADKFNLNYKFGGNLRSVPEDRKSMQAYVDFLQDRLSKTKIDTDNLRAIVKLYGEIGAYSNILGNYDAAVEALTKSLTLIEEKNLGNAFWATHTIRYGDSLCFKKDYLGAETAYRSVLEMSERFPEVKDLEDFAWQHLGKLKIDENDFKTAQECLMKAKSIREKKGIKELLDSTQLALQFIQAKLSAKKKY